MPGFVEPSEARAAKARVRAAMLGRRRSTPPAVRTAADLRLHAETLSVVRTVSARRIAAYAPYPTEPGGVDLPDVLRSAGLVVLLPVLLDDRDLDWAERDGTAVGVNAVAGVDLVVVPAVAVDRRGVRLGRGGGSYDRALARVPAAIPVVALLYDGELVDEVPAEPHDRLVGAAITPERGIVDLPTSTGRARVD